MVDSRECFIKYIKRVNAVLTLPADTLKQAEAISYRVNYAYSVSE